jgi:hypothetical protein
MAPKKRNESAVQLWEQVFARLATQENAAIMNPIHDPSGDEVSAREGFKQAGWSDAEIEEKFRLQRDGILDVPTTSPGVNPHVEAHLARLCDEIEGAMARLKLTSYEKTARGIEPRLGPYAAKINVIMTDESIITISSHLFRFCGLVARAFARTLYVNPYFWESPDWTDIEARKYLRSSPDLLKYWMTIYLSYAALGTNAAVPFKPANRNELMLFEQIARAMELFAIAHEYGHHDLDHGRDISIEPQVEEYQADQFALKICYEIEREPLIFENPYLSSGAGGIVLLLALEMWRGVESLLDGKTAKPGSHPEALSRIERFRSVSVLKPAEFRQLDNFRAVCGRVMTAVNSELMLSLRGIPSKVLTEFPRLKFGNV